MGLPKIHAIAEVDPAQIIRAGYVNLGSISGYDSKQKKITFESFGSGKYAAFFATSTHPRCSAYASNSSSTSVEIGARNNTSSSASDVVVWYMAILRPA